MYDENVKAALALIPPAKRPRETREETARKRAVSSKKANERAAARAAIPILESDLANASREMDAVLERHFLAEEAERALVAEKEAHKRYALEEYRATLARIDADYAPREEAARRAVFDARYGDDWSRAATRFADAEQALKAAKKAAL